MRYHVVLDADQTPERVDVVELPGDGTSEARIDGQSAEFDVVAIGRELSVRVDGQVVDLTVEGSPPQMSVVANGRGWRVRVESERALAARVTTERERSPRERAVRSPMPGRVVKVLVAQGDAVEPGQGLVVLEAMKMENELRAREAGKVARVHVTEGAAVDGNAILITLA